jgi:hypothetical protein
MADRNAYGQPQVGNQGFSRTMKCLGSDVALATTDLALNKTVALFVVPKGFVLTSLSVVVPDMDSNGTPTLTFAIGDAGDDDRFIATGATTGQAGGTNTTLASTGLNYEFTADTEIVWKTSAAAATAVAGTIQPRLFGYMK